MNKRGTEMRGRSWAAIGGVFLSLALCSTASAQFSPGSRGLGDVYLPALGNGGYDAQHYDLSIDYDPVAHFMTSSVTLTARATQGLSEFSLDFVDYYAISSVTVNGAAATFTRDVDAATFKYKLVVTPAAGIPNNSTFSVVVNYSGTPRNFVDPDDSLEGWLRTTTSLGAFVVNQPMGAMAWYPNNNHPRDKATYDYHLTVPDAYSTAGNGELVGGRPVQNANNTKTWNWKLTYPMSSYLSTASVGLFDYSGELLGATATGATGAPLKLYSFIESALPATGTGTVNKANNVMQAARQDEIVKYVADTIGAPYPFDSHGVVAHRSPAGYALESQTKSHFGSGGISIGTLAHEIVHQWFGDSVGPASWREIWFNEGWATWWQNKRNGNTTSTASSFLTNYNATTNPGRWNTAPDALSGPAQLFDTFPVYTRPSMAFEGYRQIVGDSAFFAFQRALVTEFAYSTITGAQFVALARRIAAEHAGFDASNLAKLDEYWRQWISTPGKPTLTPATFFLSTSVPGTVGGTVPPTLSLTLGAPIAFGAFTPGAARTYSASTTATVTSSAGDATLSVLDPSTNSPGRLVNGAFTLAQPLEARSGAAAFAPVSGSPLTLKTYTGPVSNDQATLEFQQRIGANEPLRTGSYSTTLTYTLSTTNP
jgi:aminopeptidase N